MDSTHTMAGQLAPAGAARLRATVALGCLTDASPVALWGAPLAHQVNGSHLASTWTKGAIAKPATFMVFDGKNRPTRPLSELSP